MATSESDHEVLVNPELFLEAARDLLRTALLEDFDRTIRASIQNALNKRGEARWYAPWMLIMFLHSPVQNSDGCRTEVVPYPQLPAKAFADIEDGQLVGNRQAGTDSDITIYNSTRIADIVLQVSVAEAIDGGATRAKLQGTPRAVLALEAKDPHVPLKQGEQDPPGKQPPPIMGIGKVAQLIKSTYEDQAVIQAEHYKAEDERIDIFAILIVVGEYYYYREVNGDDIRSVQKARDAKAQGVERAKEGPDYRPPGTRRGTAQSGRRGGQGSTQVERAKEGSDYCSPGTRRGTSQGGRQGSTQTPHSRTPQSAEDTVDLKFTETALELRRQFGDKFVPELLGTNASNTFLQKLLLKRVVELTPELYEEKAMSRLDHLVENVMLLAMERAIDECVEDMPQSGSED